jgi:phosphate transport system protein
MSDTTTRHFQADLEQLKARLLEMGGLAEDRVRTAVDGLVARDNDAVARVIEGDRPINQLHIEIDNRCFTLLALHQPMAVDLRSIVSAVKINTDLERVGDLAINIAEAVARYLRHAPVKELIDIARMASIAQAMLRDALDAYVRRDTALAQRVLDADDGLDALKTQVFRELLDFMLNDPGTIEPALDLILISRHLERIGDHATNIAEDVIFMVLAKDVRHHEARSERRCLGLASSFARRCLAVRAPCVAALATSCQQPRLDFDPECVVIRYNRQVAHGAASIGVRVLSPAAGRPCLAAVLQRALQARRPRTLDFR